MKNHCKKNSQGLIHIDLTDHYGGFNHRVNPENYNFIKNLHEEKEWYEIIEKYFTIETWHKLFWHQNIESEDFKPHVMYDANGDELSYLKHQMSCANERIERLQSEMIFVQSVINSLSDKRRSFVIKSDQTNLNERQESSEENHQPSKETS